jgi:hypothetical protein
VLWLDAFFGLEGLSHRFDSIPPAGERGERGDRSFEKEKRMGPDGSFQPTYASR